jgi:hypothetical protein
MKIKLNVVWLLFIVCCVTGFVIPEAYPLFWSCMLLLFLNNVLKIE